MVNSTRPIIVIYDVSSGETIEREMNLDEYAQHLIDVDNNKRIEEQQAAAAKAKSDAKTALLEKLGLTQDIIDILAN